MTSTAPGPVRRGWVRDFDWTMCGVVVGLSVIGMVQVYSTTLNRSFQGNAVQHAVWLALGWVLFFGISHIRYRRLVALSTPLWALGVALLVAVLVFTEPVNGSQRWLPTPFGFTVQVSEFMKAVLVLVMAKYCHEFATRKLRRRDLLTVGLLFLVPFSLVVRQPDLSTAMSMVPLLVMALFLSTIRMKHIVAACVVALLLLPLGWSALKPYQKSRIVGFKDPDSAPRSIGYQIRQSNIAVGSGGMWGQGFVQGSQTQLRFLPTPHTDFILASFAEERGFAGVALVLALYYILLMRIVRTGQTAADSQGSLIAMGVAGMLLFHVIVNVGMVANKLPVTGLPLPLMSYGGSNLLTVMALLGLVNSVRLRRFVN